MRLHNVLEGASLAVWAVMAHKLRSALTILGIVIGVATAMAMASIVEGLRKQIIDTVEVAGPTTFYVVRFFSQTPLNPDNLPREVRIRPPVKEEEAIAIDRLPEVSYSGIWIQLFPRLEAEGVRTQTMTVFAADDHYMEMQGGTLLAGRFFTESELRNGRQVFVIEETIARRLFGRKNPIAETVN